MPNIYTTSEYADIVFVYGYCDGNARAAVLEYARRFPMRRVPDKAVFTRTFQRLRETGTTSSKSRADGIFAPLHNNRRTENILEHFDRIPSSSTRRCSLQLGYSQSTVNRTLKADGRHPYHLQKVQNLLPEDLPRRREFSEWFLEQIRNDASYYRKVIWTDEATFTRAGIFNQQNAHMWAHENPHAVKEQHFQHEFSCNVWMGLCDDTLIGPYFLPPRLNGPAFLHFLENEFETILDDMPLIDRANRWFQLDGCPAHYTLLVRQWLHNHFPGRWIGRGRDCPRPWPPRSPDLTTMDFYVWGKMKSIVYAEPVNDEASLRARILQAAQEIPLAECRAAAQSVIRRCQLCIENDGGHFEQFL